METPSRDVESDFFVPEFNLNNDDLPEPEGDDKPNDKLEIDWTHCFEGFDNELPSSDAGGGGNKPPQEPPTPSASEPGDDPLEHLNRWENELETIEPLVLSESGETKKVLGSVWEVVPKISDRSIFVDEGELVVTNEASLGAKIEPGEYGVAIFKPEGKEVGLVHFDPQTVGGPSPELSISKLSNFLDSTNEQFGGDKLAVVFSPSGMSQEEIQYHAENLDIDPDDVARGTSDRISFFSGMIKDAVAEKIGEENVAHINLGQLQVASVSAEGVAIFCNSEESAQTFTFKESVRPDVVASQRFETKTIIGNQVTRNELLSRIKTRDWVMYNDGERGSAEPLSYDLDLNVDMNHPENPKISLALTSNDVQVGEISAFLEDKTLHILSMPDEEAPTDELGRTLGVDLPLTLTGRMRHLARGIGCDRITMPDARSVWEKLQLEGEPNPDEELKLLKIYDGTGQELGFFHDVKAGMWYKNLNFGTPRDMA